MEKKLEEKRARGDIEFLAHFGAKGKQIAQFADLMRNWAPSVARVANVQKQIYPKLFIIIIFNLFIF